MDEKINRLPMGFSEGIEYFIGVNIKVVNVVRFKKLGEFSDCFISCGN